jgi:ribosome assembly protein YihI (activator of Der GTPase)
MTDLIQALSTALARLATLEEIVARLDRLERTIALVEINGFHEARLDRLDTLLHELGTSVARTDDRVGMLESGVSDDDLEDRIGAMLDRKLDRVLEDALDNALSGREITVTL